MVCSPTMATLLRHTITTRRSSLQDAVPGHGGPECFFGGHRAEGLVLVLASFRVVWLFHLVLREIVYDAAGLPNDRRLPEIVQRARFHLFGDQLGVVRFRRVQ